MMNIKILLFIHWRKSNISMKYLIFHVSRLWNKILENFKIRSPQTPHSLLIIENIMTNQDSLDITERPPLFKSLNIMFGLLFLVSFDKIKVLIFCMFFSFYFFRLCEISFFIFIFIPHPDFSFLMEINAKQMINLVWPKLRSILFYEKQKSLRYIFLWKC